MDPRRQCQETIGARSAHVGSSRGGRSYAGDDQPHLGGEDSSVSAIRRPERIPLATQQAVCGHDGCIAENLLDGRNSRTLSGRLHYQPTKAMRKVALHLNSAH